METLKFSLMLLMPTIVIVSSTKCQNSDIGCIELCCAFTQIYETDTNYCEALSKKANDWWQALWHDNKTMKYVEYGECEISNNSDSTGSSVIQSCYSPFYDKDLKQYFLKEYFNVPCKRLRKFNFGKIVLVFLTIVLLPIILVYTFTRKGNRNIITFKLVTWYLTSMVATLLAEIGIGFFNKTLDQTSSYVMYLMALPYFFFTSTFFWLSAIGYEIYKSFKASNNVADSRQVRRRFICYSLYVWGATISIYFIAFRLFDFNQRGWTFVMSGGPTSLIALCNIFIFLVLSLKICIIRCRVANMTTEDNFVCNIFRIILRLCLMMGIPRMLCVILEPLPFIGITAILVLIYVEPYVVFLTFVTEGENLKSLCSKCCCFKRTDKVQEIGNTNKTILQKSTTV